METIDESHDVNHNASENSSGNGAENALNKLKREEIVFVLQTADAANAEYYLVYSLSERAPANNDDGDSKPFTLSVLRVPKPQLPENLSEFLLDRGNLPVSSHLRPPREVHVVVSTGSGLRRAPEFYGSVLRPLLGALGLEERGESHQDGNGNGPGYRLTVTKDSNTIRDFAGELGRDGTTTGERTIILLSGDGGVVDLLNGLDRADPPQSATGSGPGSGSGSPTPPTIALLPLGTGNALFHSLHKPLYNNKCTSPESDPAPSPLILGLRTLFQGTPAPLPTFRASFSPGAKLVSAPTEPEPDDPDSVEEEATKVAVDHLVGAIVASYGFHASLVWESDTPAYRVHGDKRFGMAAAELLKVSHAYDATVTVRRRGGGGEFIIMNLSDDNNDNNRREGGGRLSYVLTTLVSNLERTFTISPASRPLDGQLRLVHFGDVGGDRTMEIMMAAYRDGEHVGMDGVGYEEEVEEVMVAIAEEDPRWRKVCVDGSIVEVEKGGWMRVRREERERLRVLVDAAVITR
ncbi:ATP-NAD kinase-like domain-containing protein [Chaetomium strumarium]|uniref:ATP-NAD kinase-like domain-containing protein n=1 Tax=Chaetomium strumarium TaxID=1170767 RepID=A0AAJ0GWN3_9PEZI|nr:ATP-NAD kinase-like domain-containing protein [Chaetomium strumarium]